MIHMKTQCNIQDSVEEPIVKYSTECNILFNSSNVTHLNQKIFKVRDIIS